jgi:hypothetical protein
MQIKAKFIGRSSLGYVSGRTYALRMSYIQHSYWIGCGGVAGACEYESFNAFKRNWSILYEDHGSVRASDEDLNRPEFQEIRSEILCNSRNQKLNQLIQ